MAHIKRSVEPRVVNLLHQAKLPSVPAFNPGKCLNPSRNLDIHDNPTVDMI